MMILNILMPMVLLLGLFAMILGILLWKKSMTLSTILVIGGGLTMAVSSLVMLIIGLGLGVI